VLVVDDEASVREAYRQILTPARPGRISEPELDAMEEILFGARAVAAPAVRSADEVVYATQGQEAHAHVVASLESGRPFSVAFVDMRMPPGWDGLETIERIWKVDPRIQVVVATAFSDRAWQEIVAKLGRADGLLLLKKPFDASEVRQLVAALGEKWDLARRSENDMTELRRLADRLQSANTELEREVEERRSAEERLLHHAYYDSLTGLPNRMRLLERLERSLARAKQDPERTFAVLFLDLDSFKLVNDSLGHDVGDRLLIEVAHRLVHGLRTIDGVGRLDEDPASRLGGDEFVVILDGIRTPTDAAHVAERLLQMVSDPIDLGVQHVALSASIGIAVAGPQYDSADALLRDADTAMYRAKAHRSRLALFDPAMHAEARSRLSMESDLRRAVAHHHFSLAYQPIVHAASGRIAALEALIRWDHPGYPRRSPADFIPVAEDTGLIVPLGRWVLEESCRTLASLRLQSAAAHDLRLNVNVSRRQLTDPHLARDVREILDGTGVPADRVALEITESAIMGDVDDALVRLKELKAVGVGLHLDDFGTGYSSLACLQRFPLDVVKIDRAFVTRLGECSQSAAVVEAIVTIAHRLGIQVTVEGVETEPQLAAIREIGSDYAQGYYFHRPQPIDAIRALFPRGEATPAERTPV
jgi:diguanylate cyclase (GGDEF)-like protein